MKNYEASYHLLLKCKENDEAAAIDLIENRQAIVNISNVEKQTPLHFAVQNTNLNLTRYLLKKGANINDEIISQLIFQSDAIIKNCQSTNIEHILTDLIRAGADVHVMTFTSQTVQTNLDKAFPIEFHQSYGTLTQSTHITSISTAVALGLLLTSSSEFIIHLFQSRDISLNSKKFQQYLKTLPSFTPKEFYLFKKNINKLNQYDLINRKISNQFINLMSIYWKDQKNNYNIDNLTASGLPNCFHEMLENTKTNTNLPSTVKRTLLEFTALIMFFLEQRESQRPLEKIKIQPGNINLNASTEISLRWSEDPQRLEDFLNRNSWYIISQLHLHPPLRELLIELVLTQDLIDQTTKDRIVEIFFIEESMSDQQQLLLQLNLSCQERQETLISYVNDRLNLLEKSVQSIEEKLSDSTTKPKKI